MEALNNANQRGAVKRIRPKIMTATTFSALVPILWSSGAGVDVMCRIATPMVRSADTAVNPTAVAGVSVAHRNA